MSRLLCWLNQHHTQLIAAGAYGCIRCLRCQRELERWALLRPEVQHRERLETERIVRERERRVRLIQMPSRPRLLRMG